MLRQTPKDHGDPSDRYSVGRLIPGASTIILEDVSTTGQSGEPAIENVQKSGLLVKQFKSIASRREIRDDGKTVEQFYMEKFKVPYDALTDITTLLPAAAKEFSVPKSVLDAAEDYMKKYCSVQVKLY